MKLPEMSVIVEGVGAFIIIIAILVNFVFVVYEFIKWMLA